MDGAAVVQTYGFDPGLGDAGDLGRRMSKRRRLEQLAGSHASVPLASWQQPQQQQQQQQSQQGRQHAAQGYPSPASVSPYPVTDTASTYVSASSNASLPAYNESVPTELHPVGARWDHAVAYPSDTFNPYPDVAASYHQPYYYGQTDPSTYIAPWPPATHEQAAYAPNATAYPELLPAQAQRRSHHGYQRQSTTMPFLSNAGDPEEVNFSHPSAEDSFSSMPDIDSVGHFALQSRIATGGLGRAHDSAVLYYNDDASMHLKLQSLPSLDNLATQLIQHIARCTYAQIQDLMQGAEGEESQAYRTVKDLFDQTRKVYTRDSPFIDPVAVQMFQPSHQEVVRKANIATFVSSILGAHDVSFFHLNQYFMETFVPVGHRLLKWQGAVFLELKTQTYISALMNSDGSPEALLDELFPNDLDSHILARHPDAPSLSPSEQDFIDRSRSRRSYLFAEPSSEEAPTELPNKYQWNDFVREFAGCIGKNIDSILSTPSRAQPLFNTTNNNMVGRGRPGSSNLSEHSGLWEGAADPQNRLSNGSLHSQSMGNANILPHQQQTSETKKGTTTATTVRQPWTKPEEDALLSGLERVNGPHWSQILALYGRGGSVSEVLKDRNQVQLKDKARNLKLWYLKMGKDVPHSLRGVTGELRKRGGARARAALEAEENLSMRERSASEGAESEGVDEKGKKKGNSR